MNTKGIIAQARKWASLAGVSAADLSSYGSAQTALYRATDLVWKEKERNFDLAPVRWTRDINGLPIRVGDTGVRTAQEFSESYARAEGAYRVLRGLFDVLFTEEIRSRSEHGEMSRCVLNCKMRSGFLDCAAGLATIISASDGARACESAQHAARKGAKELFDTLTREEES